LQVSDFVGSGFRDTFARLPLCAIKGIPNCV
jgi:hypothetical protein